MGKSIASFKDLIVYQEAYRASIDVMLEIVSKLPDSEKYDLKDQLRRSCKAISRLIAEGYAKKHQRAGFRKYLDDALGESNEIIVSLNHAKDLYYKYVDIKLCDNLINRYDILGKQIYRLAEAWVYFRRKPSPTS
ncbi:MAG: four helix bundle protein [Candidatus Omnitrophica bacterium]|nr:four helix bundle protein [Candidatus Omnitrophota bacterium]MBU4590625.1 four helix bundle protein [Candidatus Omnitrophota bacterium]